MVAQDGHSSVSSVVGEQLSCNTVFSWKKSAGSLFVSSLGVGEDRADQNNSNMFAFPILSQERAVLAVEIGKGHLGSTKFESASHH